jgi:hypothetical protein
MSARPCSVAFIAFIALACARGSDAPASPAPAAPVVAAPEPTPIATRPTWLYEIHTASQPSYVFAALDPGCPLHECFPDDYLVLFRYARQVIVTDAQTAEEADASMTTSGLDRSGSLERSLGPERFALLANTLHDLLPAGVIRYLRPIWAAMLLGLALSAEAYGVGASDLRISPGHDAVSRRRMSNAAILGIFDHEEVDRELSAMAPHATDALRAALDRLDEERAWSRSLLAAYRAADEVALLGVHAQATAGSQPLWAISEAGGQHVLDERISLIETELRAGNALVVLPYYMVLGERGLLARLGADEFDVDRLSAPAAP